MNAMSLLCILILFWAAPALSQTATPYSLERKVAITIDDLPVVTNFPRNEDELFAITNRLVSKIVELEIPAYGFVIGAKMRVQGAGLLDVWLDAGLQLGNHSYSHPDANVVGAETFTQDVMRGDIEIRPLLQPRNQALEYFRFPMLRRGNTVELKDDISEFLNAKGYRSAPVSIDNQDWVFNRVYDRAIARNDTATMKKVGLAYVDYLENIFEFFENKSIEVLSYEPKQILLLHANALNTEYLDEVAEMLRKRGYEFISLEEALTDPIYSYPETYIGNRGVSWIHRVTDSKGMPIQMEPHESIWLNEIDQK